MDPTAVLVWDSSVFLHYRVCMTERYPRTDNGGQKMAITCQKEIFAGIGGIKSGIGVMVEKRDFFIFVKVEWGRAVFV